MFDSTQKPIEILFELTQESAGGDVFSASNEEFIVAVATEYPSASTETLDPITSTENPTVSDPTSESSALDLTPETTQDPSESISTEAVDPLIPSSEKPAVFDTSESPVLDPKPESTEDPSESMKESISAVPSSEKPTWAPTEDQRELIVEPISNLVFQYPSVSSIPSTEKPAVVDVSSISANIDSVTEESLSPKPVHVAPCANQTKNVIIQVRLDLS